MSRPMVAQTADVGEMAEHFLTTLNTLRLEETLALHPAFANDPRLVREIAVVLKAQIYTRTGDQYDMTGVILPIARHIHQLVSAFVEGGMR